MKSILLGLMLLGSPSAFALDECEVDVVFNTVTSKIEVILIKNNYLIYLMDVKPCKDTFMELSKNASLEAEVSGQLINIKYIYQQKELGNLNSSELKVLKQLGLIRNASVMINGDDDVVFEKN